MDHLVGNIGEVKRLAERRLPDGVQQAGACQKALGVEMMDKDEAREQRIHNEIIVDAYGEEERALGWYYYFEEKLNFPFKAKCVAQRTISPLVLGEEVRVVGMAQEEDCDHEIFVLIDWQGRSLGVPLSQLEPMNVDEETRTAVEDWQYWVAIGYEF